MATKTYLSRRAYAQAVASGSSQAEAARAAGSKARSTPAQTRAGARLGRLPGVQALVDEYCAANAAETHDDWGRCLERLLRIINRGDTKDADVIRAVATYGKATGRFAAKRIEHTGTGGAAFEASARTMCSEDRGALRDILARASA